MGNVIEGVGQEAEVITNKNGGKQSKSPATLHLVDPEFLMITIGRKPLDDDEILSRAILDIVYYMNDCDREHLITSINRLEQDRIKQLLTIGKVLQYGAERYAPGNWRLIPREEHINHALIHLVASLAGDTQDDHIEHAMCRIHMAIATKESEGFSYTKPCMPRSVETNQTA